MSSIDRLTHCFQTLEIEQEFNASDLGWASCLWKKLKARRFRHVRDRINVRVDGFTVTVSAWDNINVTSVANRQHSNAIIVHLCAIRKAICTHTYVECIYKRQGIREFVFTIELQ